MQDRHEIKADRELSINKLRKAHGIFDRKDIQRSGKRQTTQVIYGQFLRNALIYKSES